MCKTTLTGPLTLPGFGSVHCASLSTLQTILLNVCLKIFQQAPSAFLAEMQLTTEEKLRLTCEMRIPQIVELLDMSETTHQKVDNIMLLQRMNNCNLSSQKETYFKRSCFLTRLNIRKLSLTWYFN